MSKKAERLYEFGPFRLDVAERRLLRHQEVVPLSPKVFDTLLALVENDGHVMGKDELMERLWPDSFVEESSLTQNISLLRRALGEGSGEQKFIETVPKRGYRFAALVRAADGGAGVEAAREIVLTERSETRVVIDEDEEVAPVMQTLPDGAVAHALSLPAAPRRWPLHDRRALWLACTAALLLLAVLAGVLIWGVGKGGQREVAGASAGGQVRSLAVLPFKPIGDDNQDEFLGVGMADALIVKLSNFDQVSVRPTSSIIKYTGREHDAQAVGRALGVDAVLDGTLQHAGERVRLSVVLIRLSDGKTLWSGKFDERFTDIFSIQDSVSARVADVLQLKLGEGKQPQLNKRFTGDLEAYRYYMMGIYFWNKRTREGLTKAAEYLQKATEIDPDYALAHAMLADTLCLSVYYGYNELPAKETYQRAKAAAERALELDDTLAEAHASMAFVKASYGQDPRGAEQSYRRAIELGPNSAVAHLRYATYLLRMLRLDDAIGNMRRAQELDPLSPNANLLLGTYYGYAGRYDEAVKYCRIALELEPEQMEARFNLAEVYGFKGMREEAAAEFSKLADKKGAEFYGKVGLAYVYADQGRKAESRQLLSEVKAQFNNGKAPADTPFQASLVHIALGERKEAFALLEKTLADRSVGRYELRYNRKLDPLKSDPLFEQMLSQHEYTKPLALELSKLAPEVGGSSGGN